MQYWCWVLFIIPGGHVCSYWPQVDCKLSYFYVDIKPCLLFILACSKTMAPHILCCVLILDILNHSCISGIFDSLMDEQLSWMIQESLLLLKAGTSFWCLVHSERYHISIVLQFLYIYLPMFSELLHLGEGQNTCLFFHSRLWVTSHILVYAMSVCRVS